MKYGVLLSCAWVGSVFLCSAMEVAVQPENNKEAILKLLAPECSVDELRAWLAENTTYCKSDESNIGALHYLIDRYEQYSDINPLIAKIQELVKAGINANELRDVGTGPDNVWQTPLDRVNILRAAHGKCPSCCLCHPLERTYFALLQNNGYAYHELKLIKALEAEEDGEPCCIL